MAPELGRMILGLASIFEQIFVVFLIPLRGNLRPVGFGPVRVRSAEFEPPTCLVGSHTFTDLVAVCGSHLFSLHVHSRPQISCPDVLSTDVQRQEVNDGSAAASPSWLLSAPSGAAIMGAPECPYEPSLVPMGSGLVGNVVI